MPFKSEKQRRYLHANHPEIAKRWEREYSTGTGYKGVLSLEDEESEDISLTAFNSKFDDVPELTEEKEEEKINLFSETEESDPLNELLLAEDGVTTLFRAKNGGTPQLAKKSKDGTRPGYRGSDWGPGASSPGTTSTGQNVNTGGDGNTNREQGIVDYHSRLNEISKEKQRQEDLKNLVEKGPGSIHEKYGGDKYTEEEIGQMEGVTPAKRAQIKSTLVRDRVMTQINELKNNIKSRFTPKKVGWNILTKTFPVVDLAKSLKDQYEIDKLTQELVDRLEEEKALYEKKGFADFHPAIDTRIQELDQEILDLTQTDTRDDEDTKGDGPTTPVVAPVTEEIEDSYAQATGFLQGYRDLKARQALSAQLQQKWADEREWQQNTMFANRGGLANLFRVKN